MCEVEGKNCEDVVTGLGSDFTMTVAENESIRPRAAYGSQSTGAKTCLSVHWILVQNPVRKNRWYFRRTRLV